MLWCILFVHFVLRMLSLSLNLSIFLKIFSTLPNPFLWHFHEISFRTLCCLAPFELVKGPTLWAGASSILLLSIMCCSLSHHVIHVPACSFSLWIWLQWFIRQAYVATVLVVLSNLDVLTDTEGEEHSSSRPIVLGWLRVYIFIVWCFGGYGCIWCVRFVCRRCCYYREPVGHSLLICLRRRCRVAMSCCWTSLFDLSSTVKLPILAVVFSVTSGSYLFSEEAPLRPSRLLSMTIRCPTV